MFILFFNLRPNFSPGMVIILIESYYCILYHLFYPHVDFPTCVYVCVFKYSMCLCLNTLCACLNSLCACVFKYIMYVCFLNTLCAYVFKYSMCVCVCLHTPCACVLKYSMSVCLNTLCACV